MIRLMVMVFLCIWMERNMKANDRMISSMAGDVKYGRMELLLKVIISKAKNKVKKKK